MVVGFGLRSAARRGCPRGTCAPQVALIEDGRAAEVVQETRSWDEVKQATASMRSKEGLADYRFFPEPDLSLLTLTEEDIAVAAVCKRV